MNRAPRTSSQPKISSVDRILLLEAPDGVTVEADDVSFKLGDGSSTFTAGSLHRSTVEAAEGVDALKASVQTTLGELKKSVATSIAGLREDNTAFKGEVESAAEESAGTLQDTVKSMLSTAVANEDKRNEAEHCARGAKASRGTSTSKSASRRRCSWA